MLNASSIGGPPPVPGVLREIAAHPEAEAIVLGCAGMSNLMDRLSAEHGVPVLDGVACATTLAEAILSCGLKASKSGGYAPSRHYCDLPQLSS